MQAELAPQRHPLPLLLAPVGGKTVALDCDGGRLSSDAGLVLLKDIDEQLGLTRALAAALSASRDARRIRFTLEDLLKPDIEQVLREKKPFILRCMLDGIKKLQGRMVTWNKCALSVSITWA
jgi:hypothetical protein